MSGGSKYQTVGYKYYLGVHFVLCQGPVDRLLGILVDEKIAWSGSFTEGAFQLTNEDLFGGNSREGGVSGLLDFMQGGPTQPVNSYLASVLGAENLSAYRKVASVVLNQFYVGLNPYLKKWAFRVQRVLNSTDGAEQWNPTRAAIRQMDGVSRSMHLLVLFDAPEEITAPKLEQVKAALIAALAELFLFKDAMETDITLTIARFNQTVSEQTWVDIQPADYAAVATFINGMTVSGWGDWRLGMTYARNYFAAIPADGRIRRMLFISNDARQSVEVIGRSSQIAADMIDQTTGSFNIAAGTQVDIAAVSIGTTNWGLKIFDNTPGDSVPIVTSTSVVDMSNAFVAAISPGASIDMNPAHIIREGITDPDFGLGYNTADVNDDSFIAAAETLWNERMGISILWNRQQTMEDFIGEIQRHIDASVFVDKTTGLWNIKLIRDDYDQDELPHLNTSNILSISNFKYTALGDLVTSVTASFRDARLGRKSTISLQNIALEQYQGARINHAVDYPGFTSIVLMGKIVGRDLRALSREQIACDITTTRDAFNLNPGSPFVLDWPEYGIFNQVMRVDEIDFGSIRDQSIKIRATSDVFDTPATAFVSPPSVDYTPPSQNALPVVVWDASEMTYYDVVQQAGESAAASMLATEPDAGYLSVAAASPGGSAISGQFWVDAGAGYEQGGSVYFCPMATVADNIDQMETFIRTINQKSMASVALNTYAKIDDELVCVVETGPNGIIVKRGVLDSAVKPHFAGADILFSDAFIAPSPVEYVATDVVDVKVISISGSGESPLDAAMVKTVEFNSRAIRPYPPGNVMFLRQGFGWFYFPSFITIGSPFMQWDGRNRLQQTAAPDIGFLYSHIEPEPGTTYRLKFYRYGELVLQVDGMTDRVFDPTPEHRDLLHGDLVWELYSVRDGYESFYPQTGQLFALKYSDSLIYENGDQILLENGVDVLINEEY